MSERLSYSDALQSSFLLSDTAIYNNLLTAANLQHYDVSLSHDLKDVQDVQQAFQVVSDGLQHGETVLIEERAIDHSVLYMLVQRRYEQKKVLHLAIVPRTFSREGQDVMHTKAQYNLTRPYVALRDGEIVISGHTEQGSFHMNPEFHIGRAASFGHGSIFRAFIAPSPGRR